MGCYSWPMKEQHRHNKREPNLFHPRAGHPSPSSPAFFPPANELLRNDTIEIDENALDVSHHKLPALK